MKQKILIWIAAAVIVAGFIGCSLLGSSGVGPGYGEMEAHECATRAAC